MSFFANLFRREPDPKAALVPLWNAVVAVARRPRWYAECGAADTLEGRFDVLTAVLAIVLLRMEREEDLHGPSVLLTELFVDDMEGQLREQGIGDPALGKRVGRLMGALGGRLGAYRGTIGDEAALGEAVARNMTFAGEPDARCVAQGLREFAAVIEGLSARELLQAGFAR